SMRATVVTPRRSPIHGASTTSSRRWGRSCGHTTWATRLSRRPDAGWSRACSSDSAPERASCRELGCLSCPSCLRRVRTTRPGCVLHQGNQEREQEHHVENDKEHSQAEEPNGD